MKNWIQIWCTVLVLTGLASTAEAGLLDKYLGKKDCKNCDCAADCAPESCKPTITRPCNRTVHTYQRRRSEIKPTCCDSCAAPEASCAPESACCTNGVRDQGCAPESCCDTNGCCDCGAPAGCCDNNSCDGNSCDGACCNVDPCKLAELIFESQTACYAKQRARAIHKLGRRYDCVCSPSVMVAFIYALNDADERVRAAAADEIGNQVKTNQCCCSPEVTAALTCALADCDGKVRRYAARALRICGYKIVKGSCDSCDSGACDNIGCCDQNGCAPAGNAIPVQEKTEEVKLAPAPPSEPSAYFPTQKKKASQNRLANLFGLLD